MIPKIETTFENIYIAGSDIEVKELDNNEAEFDEKGFAFTRIYINPLFFNGTLLGPVRIYLKSQQIASDLSVYFYCNISATPKYKYEQADTVCKTMQYLFAWIEDYAEKIGIEDSFGRKFEMPSFLYSRDRFINGNVTLNPA
jgi:hypothetical protein